MKMQRITHMDLKTGALPYADGSGYAASMVVQQTSDDAEPQLQIKLVSQISISDWPTLRTKIDRLVYAAKELLP